MEDVRTAHPEGRPVSALARCQPLDGTLGPPAVPAQHKARRAYENRVATLTLTGS
ncbi:hypothetical protein [Streptomyces sp. NPDC048057]|uniref:hypothetical protein n=1 Tax=Streptomyces sp. NPDC048057 TaxID=3155628 RepID=UPI0033D17AA0